MASGTKVLVSFCAMVIGVLVLYYGVIMPANEPVNPAGADGTIPQKMAAANPKSETAVGSETPGTNGQPALIEPTSSRTEGTLNNPLTADANQPPAGDRSSAPPTNDGLTADSLSRGPLDVTPVGSLNDATEITINDPAVPVATDKDQPAASNGTGGVQPLDDHGQPRKVPVQSPDDTAPLTPITPRQDRPTVPTTQPASTVGTPATTEYTIKAGDTGVSIAKDWFGDGNKWTLISKANPWVDFNKLQIGQKIKLPPKNATAATVAPATPVKSATDSNSGVYVVRSGDTLIKIARDLYNDASKWEAIYAANRKTIGDDPAELQAGMKLTLPSAKTTKPAAS